MSEFDRSLNFRRSVRRGKVAPRVAPKPPENQVRSSPVATGAVVSDKNNTIPLRRRDYSCDRNETTTTTVSNNSKINDQLKSNNNPKTSDGGDSAKFDFNAIQNYINKLEFNVLMGNKTTATDERISREDMTSTLNKDKDNASNTFVRGGANRTSVQNHVTANHDNGNRRKPILRTRSDTERVDVLRKQMLVKSANQNMTFDGNSMSKQQVNHSRKRKNGLNLLWWRVRRKN
jgi:hypothetical protein